MPAPTTDTKRRPGRPRENPTPAMLTIRTTPELYEEMMAEVEQEGPEATQRGFIEEAIKREVARRERNRARRRG